MRNMASLFVSFLALLAISCGEGAGKEVINIATSANMQFAMEALVEEFQNNNKVNCDLVLGSSGKLTAQIKEGAPYDVFIAANMDYPREVEVFGKAALAPRVYARGYLVLYSARKGLQPSIRMLSEENIKHIALANPRTAPYGQAAMEVLEHYKIKEAVVHKLVYGENISQASQFMVSGAAEIGFTSLSMALSPAMRDSGKYTVLPDSLYAPLEQGVVLLARKPDIKQGAREFYEFLFSARAAEILKNFGYSVYEQP
jgi:molybdate transport system substrate-binding protein